MASEFFLEEPKYWVIPWILQSIAYYFILKKIGGLRNWTAVIPFLAEKEFSTVLFRKMRTFWRPFIIALVFVIGAYYLGPSEGTGHVYMVIGYIVYGIFLIKLYYRLSKSFGKGIPYTILMVLCPTVFLLILGLGKSEYQQLEFKPERKVGHFFSSMNKILFALVSLVEVVVLVLGVGYWTVRTYPPRPLVRALLNDVYSKTSELEIETDCVTREETMGEAAATLADMPTSREQFFPDHSNDKSVVVLNYIIGSNLEDRAGLASANIRMMQDATKKGDALTFVLEAGGSKRWFTSGIKDSSYGRYTINGGNIEKVEDLEPATMEDPNELKDFITWAAENYPADRYMLVLWDHGGGVPFGYGSDQLQHRTDTDISGFSVPDITNAIKEAGVKFDVIGFDACLMQDIEIARAFEPYADYYIASEETEGGLGWYYTSAFGKLAENPGISTEEFGKDVVSAYDAFNTKMNEGKPDTAATLSFVDLTRVKSAYRKVSKIFSKADTAIRKNSKDFAEFGLAAMNSYNFVDSLQIDLIDFLSKLGDTDINDSICSPKEREAAINAVKACVICRNRDSAEGINGMALALPYKDIRYYSYTETKLHDLGLSTERSFFNDIFSIIAVQKKAEHDSKEPNKFDTIGDLLGSFSYTDYTKQDWYVKGFEDYAPDATLVDIPLFDTGDGWTITLPDKTWDIIADCRTAVYQKDDDGRLRYIGADHIGGVDSNGHPMVDIDDKWVHINGQLVCYEDNPVKETEAGSVFTGETKALLNGTDEIIVHIEWDPVADDVDAENGHITGYDFVENDKAFMEKGTHSFKSGDRITFLFDYYDEEGNLTATEPYGSTVFVSTMDKLKVEDTELDECYVQFLGVLTDVYQRTLMTEVLEAEIGDE